LIENVTWLMDVTMLIDWCFKIFNFEREHKDQEKDVFDCER